MCVGPESKICSGELKMEENRTRVLRQNCSRLLELAAMDDVAGFKREVEEMGSAVGGVSFWYGRSFGSKKMGYEERTPIMIASLYGSIEVLRYIVGSGKVDVNRACGLDGATALHCAAAGGSWSSVEAVRLLIDAGGDTDAVDANGKRAGDLIAASVKNSSNLKRKELEMMLNGVSFDGEEEEGCLTPRTPRKEYPIDASMPDINNGLYGSDEFRMYTFKVKPCSRAYSHDWTECPFVHPGENARRRDPMKYQYTCVPCPEFKKGNCVKGDGCEYAHGVFESWLHPAQYKTRLCKDETGCARKVCFFAHRRDEMRPLYASTGSALPSPKSTLANSMDMSSLSPLSLGSPSMMMANASSPVMSPSVNCSSPMSGGNMWQNKPNHTPPALQLPGSRLKTALSARDVDSDMQFLGLEKIRTRQRFAEEMAGLSSPYGGRMGDINPTNLDDFFGSHDPSLLQMQGLSPNNTGSYSQSPRGLQARQNPNQLRASYPSNVSSSPARKYGFDSSAAVASAIMNSRSSAFAKRSQSFVDRSGGNYRSGFPGSANSPSLMPTNNPPAEWGMTEGRIDWGFNTEEANKFRKSASFGFRSSNGSPPTTAMAPSRVEEPDVSWVNSLVKDVPSGGGAGLYSSQPHWIDQVYIDPEQLVVA